MDVWSAYSQVVSDNKITFNNSSVSVIGVLWLGLAYEIKWFEKSMRLTLQYFYTHIATYESASYDDLLRHLQQHLNMMQSAMTPATVTIGTSITTA